MSRLSLLPLALVLASIGGTGFVYLKTRQPATHEPVLQVERVAQAVATTSAKSFDFHYSIAVSAEGNSLEMSGNGSSDLAHGLASMTMHIDNAPAGVSAAQASSYWVVDSSNGFVEYVRMPALEGHLPAGKSWLKIDLGALAKARGIDLGKLERGDRADPSMGFSYLRGATGVTAVGQETVGAVTTTHYRATVDLQRLAAAETDAEARDSLQRAIRLSGISTYPAEAWIDDAGYLRRMRITMPETDGTQTRVATMTVTEELSDFGTAAHVVLPPSSGVVDITALDGYGKST